MSNNELFTKIKNRLFKDYSKGKNFIKKKNLWSPLNEITSQLFGSRMDKESFNILYNDIDINNKGFINKKQFGIVAKCLIMSIIAHTEKKFPIPGREISLCIEKRELPEQMEIIDTMSENEIMEYRKTKSKKKKTKLNKKPKKVKKHNPIKTNYISSKYDLIEIDSDSENF